MAPALPLLPSPQPNSPGPELLCSYPLTLYGLQPMSFWCCCHLPQILSGEGTPSPSWPIPARGLTPVEYPCGCRVLCGQGGAGPGPGQPCRQVLPVFLALLQQLPSAAWAPWHCQPGQSWPCTPQDMLVSSGHGASVQWGRLASRTRPAPALLSAAGFPAWLFNLSHAGSISAGTAFIKAK